MITNEDLCALSTKDYKLSDIKKECNKHWHIDNDDGAYDEYWECEKCKFKDLCHTLHSRLRPNKWNICEVERVIK